MKQAKTERRQHLRLTHAAVAELTLWAAEHKEEIQAQLDSGTSMQKFADEKRAHPPSLANIFRSAGIRVPERGGQRSEDSSLESRVRRLEQITDALLAVVTRMAHDLAVPMEELNPKNWRDTPPAEDAATPEPAPLPVTEPTAPIPTTAGVSGKTAVPHLTPFSAMETKEMWKLEDKLYDGASLSADEKQRLQDLKTRYRALYGRGAAVWR